MRIEQANAIEANHSITGELALELFAEVRGNYGRYLG